MKVMLMLKEGDRDKEWLVTLSRAEITADSALSGAVLPWALHILSHHHAHAITIVGNHACQPKTVFLTNHAKIMQHACTWILQQNRLHAPQLLIRTRTMLHYMTSLEPCCVLGKNKVLCN